MASERETIERLTAWARGQGGGFVIENADDLAKLLAQLRPGDELPGELAAVPKDVLRVIANAALLDPSYRDEQKFRTAVLTLRETLGLGS